MDAEEKSTFAWELHSEADTHTDTHTCTDADGYTHAQTYTHGHTDTVAHVHDLVDWVVCPSSSNCRLPGRRPPASPPCLPFSYRGTPHPPSTAPTTRDTPV